MVLPNDYFDQTRPIAPDGNAAALYFFEHRFSEDASLAPRRAPLRDLAALLHAGPRLVRLARTPTRRWAAASRSARPPTPRVHGFPERNATEDFYILNKLAKVGTILRLAGTPVVLEGRLSDRVPIGTGKALSKLVASRRALSGFRLYHPLVFAHLAAWLRVLAATARSGGRIELALEQLPGENPFFRTGLLIEALERMGAFPAIRQAIERSSEPGDDAARLPHVVRLLPHAEADPRPARRGTPVAPLRRGARRGALHGAQRRPRRTTPSGCASALAQQERTLAASPAGLPALAADLADA